MRRVIQLFQNRQFIIALVVAFLGTAIFGIYQALNSEIGLSILTNSTPNNREPFRFEAELSQAPVNREFSIFAPQVEVNAPVIANVDGSNEKNYLPNILRGVAHYKHMQLGSVTVDGALPGQPGNIFLFGHSQIPGGSLDHYQGVFNNLEELIIGDLIKVYYQDQEYRYEVKISKVINKDDMQYLEHTETETLSLMSCWPLGLDMKRYLIQAERIN